MCSTTTFTFFFFNDTATTEIYTLSLHDALPISIIIHEVVYCGGELIASNPSEEALAEARNIWPDRKSTRLNSSHDQISYAVFCLKKKNIQDDHQTKGVDQPPRDVSAHSPV